MRMKVFVLLLLLLLLHNKKKEEGKKVLLMIILIPLVLFHSAVHSIQKCVKGRSAMHEEREGGMVMEILHHRHEEKEHIVLL